MEMLESRDAFESQFSTSTSLINGSLFSKLNIESMYFPQMCLCRESGRILLGAAGPLSDDQRA